MRLGRGIRIGLIELLLPLCRRLLFAFPLLHLLFATNQLPTADLRSNLHGLSSECVLFSNCPELGLWTIYVEFTVLNQQTTPFPTFFRPCFLIAPAAR